MAYYLLFIVALVGLDQFVKYWVSANSAPAMIKDRAIIFHQLVCHCLIR